MLTALVAAQAVVFLSLGPPPDRTGFVDADSKRIEDSVSDVYAQLQKDRSLVVTDAGSTQLHLKVVASKEEVGGDGRIRTNPLTGKRSVEAELVKVVRVRLTIGSYEKEFDGRDYSNTWTSAAGDAVRQIREWVRENRAKVCSMSACG